MIDIIEDNRNVFNIQLPDDFEKTVIGFLNSKDGGNIYIGVDDKGNIVGLKGNLDELQRKIKDIMITNIEPSVFVLFDIEVLEEDDKKYFHITIARGEALYHIKGMGLTPESCFVRVGSSTEKMPITLINEMYRARGDKVLIKNIPSPDQDLTFRQLKMYYLESGHNIGDNFERQLDFFTKDKKYNLLAYLLADNNKISIKVTKYAGTDVDKIEEYYEFGNCCLITATYRVLEKFRTENKIYTTITETNRREKGMYDFNTVREAVINSLVHNDWSSNNPPKFEFFSDRVVISSFGGIQDEFTEEEFFKGYSAPKNPELMRVFKDLDLVEHLGTGIRKILKKYPKDCYEFYPHFIIVTFKYKTNTFKNDNLEENESPKVTIKNPVDFSNVILSKIEKNIIDLVSKTPTITQSELAQLLNISDRMVRYYISELVNSGLIKRAGSNKKGVWVVLNTYNNTTNKK